ncbi:hypothetical protein ACWDSD_45495, partial [Streptomyces spiralis]
LFGTAAVAALAHDVLILVGVFAWLGKPLARPCGSTTGHAWRSGHLRRPPPESVNLNRQPAGAIQKTSPRLSSTHRERHLRLRHGRDGAGVKLVDR